MEEMTDAFLTASVLAAVATAGSAIPPSTTSEASSRPWSTRITGIANQRVKECNRILAMITELRKFGVECTEHDDGLIVHASPLCTLKEGTSIHCYDDHRVAMSFSLLGTVVSGQGFGTVLEEKRCVEKTWPGWWDELAGKVCITRGPTNHIKTASF